MRKLCWVSLVGAAAFALGCGSSTPTSPVSQTADTFDSLPNGTMVAGHWRVHVDLNTMTGTVEDVVNRDAAVIGTGFKLPINQFFNAFGGGFTLDELGITGGNLAMTYSVQHPFAAPADLSGAPTATNRADLAVAGYTTFLLPVDLSTKGAAASDPDYIGDYQFTVGGNTYTLNGKAVRNAAGYIKPNDLALPGVDTGDADTFPYLPLVDEGDNARTSSETGSAIDNGIGGTDPDGGGNYDPAAGGWQNGNIGANLDGWTGFGVLHQGQTATDTVLVDPDLAEGGEFSLDVVVIAKYIDPRDSTDELPRLNRLPQAGDAGEFRYHEPYGAVDMERVDPSGSADLDLDITGGDTDVTINLAITDMDATATVDAAALTDAADTGKIPNPSGVASVAASSAELGVADAAGVDGTTTESGRHDSKLPWSVVVPNTAGIIDGGSDGLAYVLVRCEDEEFGALDLFISVGHDLVPAPVTTGIVNETLQCVELTVTP